VDLAAKKSVEKAEMNPGLVYRIQLQTRHVILDLTNDELAVAPSLRYLLG